MHECSCGTDLQATASESHHSRMLNASILAHVYGARHPEQTNYV